MTHENEKRLEQRVTAAAEAALTERGFVTAIDIFIGLGWLSASSEQAWRQGRASYLEEVVTVNLSKISKAMRFFRGWARHRRLRPSETAYVARSRGRSALRFSKSGNPNIERAYRTHWVSPQLSERKRERLAERQSKPPELVVVLPVRDWACVSCEGSGDLLIMDKQGPLCLTCTDMDHLVFLAAGDAALTRRAKTASTLSAVVVRFSRARKRYERQGILIEEDALAVAEQKCLADEDARGRRRERDRLRRADEDADLTERFAVEIEALFPGCPAARARAIACHAATRRSGRIGRTAAGQALQAEAIELAVIAAIRHEDTDYDELLMAGIDRDQAREQVHDRVDQVLRSWRAEVAAQG